MTCLLLTIVVGCVDRVPSLKSHKVPFTQQVPLEEACGQKVHGRLTTIAIRSIFTCGAADRSIGKESVVVLLLPVVVWVTTFHTTI